MWYDVVIVGGGPAGSTTARMLASEGYHVVVLEEHERIGRPVSCAGLVTERVIKLAGVDSDVIINTIKGADVYSPGGKKIKIGDDRTHAVVIDREKFDKDVAETAMAEGAKYKFRWKASEVHEKNDGIIVKGKEEIRCSYLVGADGAMSTVAKCFGFPEPKEYIRAVQTTVPYEMQEETVKIFFGNTIAPGFFAWIIPVPGPGGKKARIGLGVGEGHGPNEYFMNFLKIIEAEKGKMSAGVIPLGIRSKFSGKNVFLVGDAAAQVKATSGGGIYPGLLAADILATSLKELLEGGDSCSYENEYMKKFGKELKKGMIMRKFFLKADDKKIDKIFDSLDSRILETINVYGDVDYPSKVARELLKKHPGLLKFLFLPF